MNEKTAVDPTDLPDAARIRRQVREFVAGFNSGDVDRMMQFYSSRYIDINLPQPEQTWSERAEYYRRIVQPRNVRLEVTVEEIVVDGSHAIARGTIHLFSQEAARSGATFRELRYMELWEKQAGAWKSIWGIDADVHGQ